MFKKIFTSSVDGKSLSKRWESLFVGVVPLLVFLSSVFDWNLVQADFDELNGFIVMLISTAVVLWQTIEHIAGWIRRNKLKMLGQGKFE